MAYEMGDWGFLLACCLAGLFFYDGMGWWCWACQWHVGLRGDIVQCVYFQLFQLLSRVICSCYRTYSIQAASISFYPTLYPVPNNED